MIAFENNAAFAQKMDDADGLRRFRQAFIFPQRQGKNCIYFAGNSLGLQPRSTATYLEQVLEQWGSLAVDGHFSGPEPWMNFQEKLQPTLSKLAGCQERELVAMNSLTVNLHLLLVSFYKPTPQRYKIICEAKAFPSDQYAFETQVIHHGFDPKEAIIEVAPRPGEHYLHQADIDAAIDAHANNLALVLFGGVNYYTGQVYNLEAISRKAHQAGAYVGFDLAHAMGNIPLQLHNWGVDFACWCSYKYLNSSPGGISGVFIHQNHIENAAINRFAGWWGYKKETRFLMKPGFEPIPTAEGWQLSNAPALLIAAHKAALDLVEDAGIDQLFEKARLLNQYCRFILDEINQHRQPSVMEILTPANEGEKGCQISLLMLQNGRALFDGLTAAGVVTDWREPNVIRVAPVPMYNSFMDVYCFGQLLNQLV